ncbi:MAG TPA: hypothetical protein VKC34_05180 [Blastocatellia bacterium]|nr:hypothetical protein [Blastocatellia bacterium]
MSIKVSQPIIVLALLFLFTPVLAQSPRIVRWQQGSPDSEQFKRGDLVIKRVKVDGVIVDACIKDTAYGIRVDLDLTNGGQSPLAIRAESIAVELTSPRPKNLAYVQPKKLENMIQNVARSQAASKELSASMATKTVVETETKYEDVTTYGADGPKTEKRLVTETKVKTVPDDHARWQAEGEASRLRLSAMSEARAAVRGALKPGTLQPGASASGAVYFSGDPSAKEVLLRVPLDGVSVEIPFRTVKKRVFLWVKARHFE